MAAEDRIDPTDATLLDAVAVALTRSSTAALDASHELLAHYGDTGDAPTQRAVDSLIDHAADALRALTDSLAETSRALHATTTRAATSPYAEAAGSSARPARRGDHFA
jgi:hypothetical protein